MLNKIEEKIARIKKKLNEKIKPLGERMQRDSSKESHAVKRGVRVVI